MKGFLKHLFSFDVTWFVIAVVIVGLVGGAVLSVAVVEYRHWRYPPQGETAVVTMEDASTIENAWYDGRYTACFDVATYSGYSGEEASSLCMSSILSNVEEDLFAKREGQIPDWLPSK